MGGGLAYTGVSIGSWILVGVAAIMIGTSLLFLLQRNPAHRP
jgi:hypothetical protein